MQTPTLASIAVSDSESVGATTNTNEKVHTGKRRRDTWVSDFDALPDAKHTKIVSDYYED